MGHLLDVLRLMDSLLVVLPLSFVTISFEF
jgi:hypothetical protein